MRCEVHPARFSKPYDRFVDYRHTANSSLRATLDNFKIAANERSNRLWIKTIAARGDLGDRFSIHGKRCTNLDMARGNSTSRGLIRSELWRFVSHGPLSETRRLNTHEWLQVTLFRSSRLSAYGGKRARRSKPPRSGRPTSR